MAAVSDFKIYYPVLQNKDLAAFYQYVFSRQLKHSLIFLYLILGGLKLLVEKIRIN